MGSLQPARQGTERNPNRTHGEQLYQREKLDQLSYALFSAEHEVAFVDWNDNQKSCRNLRSPRQIEDELAQVLPEMRIVSLIKKDSLGNFRIDQASFLKILSRYNCEPCVFDLLFGFRAVDEISEKGYGLWTARFVTPQNFTICYQLRYVELNGRQRGARWSERQVGVYHQVRDTDAAKVLLLLHAKPSSKLQSRIDKSIDMSSTEDCGNPSGNPLRVHVMILNTYIDEWRWYLDDIGTRCGGFQGNTFTAELSDEEDSSLSFTTLQTLRNIESKLLTSLAILQATAETIDTLLIIAADIDRREQTANMQTIDAGLRTSTETNALHNLRRKIASFHASTNVLKCKVEKLVELVTDGTDQKAQLVTSGMSHSVLQLTQKSVDDNVTVRVITVITLIYLPTQFVATFFGTNFVQFEASRGTIRLATDFWIFLAVAVPLTLMTLGAWLILIRRRRDQHRADLNASNQDLEKN